MQHYNFKAGENARMVKVPGLDYEVLMFFDEPNKRVVVSDEGYWNQSYAPVGEDLDKAVAWARDKGYQAGVVVSPYSYAGFRQEDNMIGDIKAPGPGKASTPDNQGQGATDQQLMDYVNAADFVVVDPYLVNKATATPALADSFKLFTQKVGQYAKDQGKGTWLYMQGFTPEGVDESFIQDYNKSLMDGMWGTYDNASFFTKEDSPSDLASTKALDLDTLSANMQELGVKPAFNVDAAEAVLSPEGETPIEEIAAMYSAPERSRDDNSLRFPPGATVKDAAGNEYEFQQEFDSEGFPTGGFNLIGEVSYGDGYGKGVVGKAGDFEMQQISALALNPTDFTLARKGETNKDAAATLKDQLTQQAGAYKVQHKATFSKDQDKIISDLANQLSQFGVKDLSDITQGTRMVIEDVYDPNYYGDGSPDVIGQKLVEVPTVVNKRTGEEIPMNKLNNAAGSGFTWYNMQFVNGTPVFYASTEETGWNAFKQKELPMILSMAKFIPGVAPFAIAAEAALALDEGRDFSDVLKDTAVKVVLHEAAAYATNTPSMFESSYYDAAGNLLSDIGEDISDVLAGEGRVGADPNYGTTTAPTKPPTLTDVTSGVGLDTGVADTALDTVTITGSPVGGTPVGGSTVFPVVTSPIDTSSLSPIDQVEVTAKKPDEPAAPPPGGLASIPIGDTKPIDQVEVTAKKPDEPAAPPPGGITTLPAGDTKPIQEVEVTASKEDIERDAREDVISGPLTNVTGDVNAEVEVTGKKPEEEKPPGPLSTGFDKLTDGNLKDLTAEEVKALTEAGLLTATLLGSLLGSDSPEIPLTTVDTEAINALRPGFTPDLTPSTPKPVPPRTIYEGLGVTNVFPPPSTTVPTSGIGALPVPKYIPPSLLGAPAPGASRVAPPLVTINQGLTQADLDRARADIAAQQAALPPVVQEAPKSPFESGLAKGTETGMRMGGIVALKKGGMLRFEEGGNVPSATPPMKAFTATDLGSTFNIADYINPETGRFDVLSYEKDVVYGPELRRAEEIERARLALSPEEVEMIMRDLMIRQGRTGKEYDLPGITPGGYATSGTRVANRYAVGGMTAPVNQPRMLSGGGDGMSDSIPATIDGTQPARLADGEFVIPADVVADIGNGSSRAGAKQLYAMMDRVRQSRHGTTKQPPEVNMNKVLPV